ncbi:MAG TPA: tetratricopeptide repeat protein [Polyangia bacterium]|jgi:uncharacterized protein (AIM24 family)|nr:tetratricopeptide repeat protein [Polyangia bacterium]
MSAPKTPPSEISSHGQHGQHGQDAATALSPAPARRGDDRDDRFLGHLATAGELVAGGLFREAEVEVLRALSGLPADLRALNLLALVRIKLGRLEEARATYREIAVAMPNDATPRRHLGLLALKLERPSEAIPDLEMAARLAPGDQQVWSYLGYAYAKTGETVEAAAAFRRAGQDTLAEELEHAAQARRPASGPKLAPLAAGSLGTPPPAAAPAGLASRGGTPPPAALVLPPPGAASPQARGSAAPISGPATSEVAARAVVLPPVTLVPVESLGPLAPVEMTPVSLLGFVLARLGLGETPPAPRGEALRLGVEDEAYVRAGVALAATGLRFEPAFRRVQGKRSNEPLAPDGAAFFRLVGPGEVWVAGAPGAWQAVSLDDDILYVREDRVLAFDGGVSWEAGAIPGDGLRMLQFRGRGCVVLRLDAPPIAVKVTEDRPALVTRANLLGWVGRLVPHRQRTNGASPFDLACQGEGVILFDAMTREPERGRASPAGARAGGTGTL